MKQVKEVAREAPISAYLGTKKIFKPILAAPKKIAEIEASPKDLIAGPRPRIAGYPANFHVRDFLACVRSRGQTRANAEVACWSHITCHALNIAQFLGRKVKFDPVKCEFIGDEEANRLRSEALREPWRV